MRKPENKRLHFVLYTGNVANKQSLLAKVTSQRGPIVPSLTGCPEPLTMHRSRGLTGWSFLVTCHSKSSAFIPFSLWKRPRGQDSRWSARALVLCGWPGGACKLSPLRCSSTPPAWPSLTLSPGPMVSLAHPHDACAWASVSFETCRLQGGHLYTLPYRIYRHAWRRRFWRCGSQQRCRHCQVWRPVRSFHTHVCRRRRYTSAASARCIRAARFLLDSRSPFLRRVKLAYYRLFARVYGWAGRHAQLAMVNSSWTENHIRHIWGSPKGVIHRSCALPVGL